MWGWPLCSKNLYLHFGLILLLCEDSSWFWVWASDHLWVCSCQKNLIQEEPEDVFMDLPLSQVILLQLLFRPEMFLRLGDLSPKFVEPVCLWLHWSSASFRCREQVEEEPGWGVFDVNQTGTFTQKHWMLWRRPLCPWQIDPPFWVKGSPLQFGRTVYMRFCFWFTKHSTCVLLKQSQIIYK